MNNVYVIGGLIGYNRTNSCMDLNIKDNIWRRIARMKEARYVSACSVFEGKLVVSGGVGSVYLNTVEAYDHVAD